nr:MAG: hypothetical protein 2 [Luteoviridae sp.]
MNYAGEYTGPYWSNGNIQESVEWGDKDPKSQLDWLSRQHDSAYAHYKDTRHREAADLVYMREAKKLAAAFPELAGNLVGYGNYTGRQFAKAGADIALATKLTGMPVLGLVKYGIEGVRDSAKRINGTYLKNELADIQGFYKTDPYKKAMPTLPQGIAVKGSLERVNRQPGSIQVVSHGQKSDARIRGWERQGAPPKSQEAFAAPLNAPGGNETIQEPIAVHRGTWFQRLRKKKKKNNVEPLESRIQRLTLGQNARFDKFDKIRKTSEVSKPKKKNKAFGYDRSNTVRVKVCQNKNVM